MNYPPTLQRLWSLAEREGQRTNCEATIVFDPIGLILSEVLGHDNYDVTPLNTSSFARTGGDGVHYSLLHASGQVTDQSPVVMTVPMMDVNGNKIVGENLRDFLSLGCQVGYFWLEQLVYNEAETIVELLHPERVFVAWDGEDYANNPSYLNLKRQLLLLKEEFGLSPWPKLEAHLQKLQQDYMPLLEFRHDND